MCKHIIINLFFIFIFSLLPNTEIKTNKHSSHVFLDVFKYNN